MNGQYRTIKIELSPHIVDLDLPIHFEFFVLSEDDSYGLKSKIFFHGIPYSKKVGLNRQSQVALQPSKLEYLQVITGCEDITLWEKMTPVFELKMEKCPSLCLPKGYLRLTYC